METECSNQDVMTGTERAQTTAQGFWLDQRTPRHFRTRVRISRAIEAADLPSGAYKDIYDALQALHKLL